MKKIKDKDVCHKCGEKGKFLHKHLWWCSWENRDGAFNLVGRCKKEKKERNYADSYD